MTAVEVNAIEIKRFHIGIERGPGLLVRLSGGATRRVWRELEKTGEGSFCRFDYSTQEAVIYQEKKS
jgi:hypothetical protein